MSADEQVAVGEPADGRQCWVRLVVNLADDFFDDVFHGDDSDGAAVLVDHHRHRHPLALQVGEQVVERLRLGHDQRVFDGLSDRCVLALAEHQPNQR